MKTGGRQKGTPNKSSKEIKNIVLNILNDNIENIENDLQALSPKERLDFIAKLLPYVLVKPTIEEPENFEAPKTPQFFWVNQTTN